LSKSIYASAAVLAASLLLAACGSSSYSGGSSSASTAKTAAATPAGASAAGTVRTASNPTAGGTILVDPSGMTLYRLSGESAAKFICTSQACLAVWHPLKASSGAAPTGASGLGTVKRPDGSEQVTYQGGPLYTFASDKAPGQTSGQGIKDVGTWGVVIVGGSSGSSSSPTPASSKSSGSSEGSSPSGGGGYAY
jgi:predicted lipoprotein with Yx(FWY)xxD motif